MRDENGSTDVGLEQPIANGAKHAQSYSGVVGNQFSLRARLPRPSSNQRQCRPSKKVSYVNGLSVIY